MSMPKGLGKATNYYNRLEAWRDWNVYAKKVEQAGRGDLVKKFTPPENAGWRKVDKAIAALREAFQQSVNQTAKESGEKSKYVDVYPRDSGYPE